MINDNDLACGTCDNGVPCCCASALACYFDNDIVGMQGWISNLAHRLFYPVDWDNLALDSVKGSENWWAVSLSQCLRAAINNQDLVLRRFVSDYSDADKDYIKAVNDLAAAMLPSRGPSDWCEKSATESSTHSSYNAAMALRYYTLAVVHSNEESTRHSCLKHDIQDFYTYACKALGEESIKLCTPHEELTTLLPECRNDALAVANKVCADVLSCVDVYENF